MLRVIRPGPSTTVQDLGRTGTRSVGESVSGVFDRLAAAIANALVGNAETAAVLELTAVGGTFQAEMPLALSLAGSAMAARIESEARPSRLLEIPQSFTLQPGDHLILGPANRGMRTYLAAQRGWCSPDRLGSRSNETAVKPGDRIEAVPSRGWSQRPVMPLDHPCSHEPIRYVDGPDAAWLDESLENRIYRVDPRSNRMGIRLDGQTLPCRSDPDRLSSPVALGAIQLAGGRPIVLGPACGTMGGYPHVGHVIAADIGRVGQLRPGEEVRFRRVELAEARRLGHEMDRFRRDWCRRLRAMARS